MSFGLKNAGATYQRLVDMVFSSQIKGNLEVYVNDMGMNTPKYKDHVKDMEETFESIRKFDMRLNPDKCTFRVQVGKFSGFMLTHWGIEANHDKI